MRRIVVVLALGCAGEPGAVPDAAEPLAAGRRMLPVAPGGMDAAMVMVDVAVEVVRETAAEMPRDTVEAVRDVIESMPERPIDAMEAPVPGRPNGAACSAGAQCSSGVCVGMPGRCCDLMPGACERCPTGFVEPQPDGTTCAPGTCDGAVPLVDPQTLRVRPCVFRRNECRAGACVQVEERDCCATISVCAVGLIHGFCDVGGSWMGRGCTIDSADTAAMIMCGRRTCVEWCPVGTACRDGACR